MTRSILVLVLALACSAPAFAQITASPSSGPPQHREWEGAGFAGYAFPQAYKFQTRVAGRASESVGTVGMEFESGYRIGARVSQNLGSFLTADMEYNFSDQPLRLTNLTPNAPNLYLSHFLHSLTYSVSYSPRPPEKRFRPYVGAGGGVQLFYLSEESKLETAKLGVGLRDSWEALFNWGGGVRHLVADRFAVIVDVKGRLTRIPTYGLPRSAQLVDGQYQPAISTRGLMHSWQINLGLAHQWDRW